MTSDQLPGSKASISVQPHVVLGFDATASRRGTWAFAAHGQRDLIEFIAKSGEIPPMLRIGYFSGNNTFQATKWMDDAKRLQSWMQTLDCQQGYTQISKLLGDIQRQIGTGIKIASVIYVGDHCEDNATTLYEQARSIAKTTPIHVLHEVACEDHLDQREKQARSIFQEITKLSGGRYVAFPQGKYTVMSDVAKVLVGRIYGPKSKVMNDLRQNASSLSSAAKLLLG